MPRRPAVPSPLPRSSRWLAVWLAVTVWALGVLAVSPELHAELHADGDGHAHECAVTLFAHGADTLDAAPALQHRSEAHELGRVAAPDPHVWAALHYRLRPACGPPLC